MITRMFFAALIVLLIIAALTVGCSGTRDGEPVELLVGAAAALRDVTEELAESWANPYVRLRFTYASSGILQTQIEQGAPIDVFMSALADPMLRLEQQGLIYGASRNIIVNSIALIVPSDSALELESFLCLAGGSAGIIGLGNPNFVAGGVFAQEILTALGIADEVYAKAVLASDIRQVLTWVERGEVDAGVVFLTDALSSDRVRIVEVADTALHSAAVSPVGIVGSSAHKLQAQEFIDYLFSDEAREIFTRHGFSIY